MKRILPAALALALSGGPALAQPQPPLGPDWSKVEIKTTDLGNRTFMLTGQGGNITVALADDGVIMVDGQFAPLADRIRAAIAALSPQPIRYLVNTHYHGDHTGGNAPFAKSGVTITAHENVRKRLAMETTHNITGAKRPPQPEAALPTVTHAEGMALALKGRTAQLAHPPRAHTDGDTFVYFADANVLSTGDTVTIGRYPNIDFLNGGTMDGMIAASDGYLALANDATRIVPGHGPLATKAQLAAFHAMLVTSRERMLRLIAEGKSEADVQALKPFADLDATWAVNEQASRNWVRVVYHAVKVQ
jgi:glyoxylase-like metal-dependent hydrolase (beta-lactamase superfamily II)